MTRISVFLARCVMLLALLGVAPAASGQTRPTPGGAPAVQAPPVLPQDQQVLEELRAIRQLLEKLVAQGAQGPAARAAAPAPDPNVSFASLPTEHMLGRADAPVTVVEFTDLLCPFCRRFRVTVFDELKKTYIDTGKVRFVTRDLPITQLHPLAMIAARAARCAGSQQKFWEMQQAILANNARVAPDSFAGFATDLGLDMAAFAACTGNTAAVDAAIKADMDAAQAASVQGTPTFVIGRTKAEGLDGLRLDGAVPFAAFDERIKALLAGKQ